MSNNAAHQAGSTRLDRLLTLLETGSNAEVRKAAAEQIGEVAKYHPYDLHNLLRRIQSFLFSKSWDTRIAAGQAVEAIASQVPQWNPAVKTEIKAETKDEKDTAKGHNGAGPPLQDPGGMTFDAFDINKVLDYGAPLLSSGGQEFDLDLGELTDIGRKEVLAAQRRSLQKRLGLGVDSVLGDFGGDMIDDEDLIRVPSAEDLRKKRVDEDAAKKSAQVMAEVANTAGMSARERNRAKRKAKQAAKDAEKSRIAVDSPPIQRSVSSSSMSSVEKGPAAKKLKTVVTEQPMNDSKVVIEAVLDKNSQEADPDEWPFELFCEELCHRLFDPVWEVRHGAGIGLREVLKTHAKGAGRVVGVSEQKNVKLNDLWLEDCCIRLLCVFALDRFGDFVSDQVVAPVRETCGQTLGAVLKHLKPEDVSKVLESLLKLLARQQWEVRHGGLLGVKYLLAVRSDMVHVLLPKILPAIVRGLQDTDDDVRAVAAEALVPVAELTCQLVPQYIPPLLANLWHILQDLDDLSSSTGSVMNLLAEFYSHPPTGVPLLDLAIVDTPQVPSGMLPPHPLSVLVPRLWPFFRHNVAPVRLASVRTFERLLAASSGPGKSSAWVFPILEPALRYVFQNVLLEENQEVLAASQAAWVRLVRVTDPAVLARVSMPLIRLFLTLLATPAGSAMDTTALLATPALIRRTAADVASVSQTTSAQGKRGRPTSSFLNAAPPAKPVIVHDYPNAVRIRTDGAALLGHLAVVLAPAELAQLYSLLLSMLSSPSGSVRMVAAVTLVEISKASCAPSTTQCPASRGPLVLPVELKDKLNQMLDESEASNGQQHYSELDKIFSKLRSECTALLNAFRKAGIDAARIVSVGPAESMSPDSAAVLASTVFSEWMELVHRRYSPDSSELSLLHSMSKRILSTVGYLESIQTQVHVGVLSSVSGALVAFKEIPSKLNPIIRELMNAVKKEENVLLQERATCALAELSSLCLKRKPCPNDKLVKNLFTLACADRTVVPEASLSLHRTESGLLIPPPGPEASPGPGRKGRSLSSADLNASLPRSGSAADLDSEPGIKRTASRQDSRSDLLAGSEAAIASSSSTTPLSPLDLVAILARRGAESALCAMARRYGPDLFVSLPKAWDLIAGPLTSPFGPGKPPLDASDADTCQSLIDSLHVLKAILRDLHPSLHPKIFELQPSILSCMQCAHAAVRTMAGRCVAAMGRHMTLQTMSSVIADVLPVLGQLENLSGRLGAAETLQLMIDELGSSLLPYVVFLVVPILARMSDPNAVVRESMTRCFATLIKLVPLESGIPDPPGMDPELLSQKQKERRFLEQLLDGSKLDPFPLPVRISAELRRYQQEGVNWMAFLNKFHLHGILCDDMGLGKTLQTLCMVSSDHFLRAQEFQSTGGKAGAPLPSLVVCPPTLVDHWYHECLKFVPSEVLAPRTYGGSPGLRNQQRKQLSQPGLVIASYETVRGDCETLSAVTWNYIVLDEGHIIKNAKAKITKAVKSLHANHRLLLTGTPIQNNVLELWSLFDFLMPGFLGSEKAFNQTYSRPILASRDPKSSSTDKEAGALAMEALHKQVLPFLLRRIKEDVLQDLPPKIIQDYYCELSPLQARLYEHFSKSRTKDELEDLVSADTPAPEDSKGSAGHMFQALQYLRKLCNHPLLVLNEQHPEYREVVSECQGNGQTLHDLEVAPKLLALKQLLNDCGIGLKDSDGDSQSNGVVGQHRVLIFAQLKSMLDLIEQDLFKRHMPSVTFMRLDGGVQADKRHGVVRQFNADPSIDVLLLTTHVGGLGLNLTGADVVIFVEHDWNPMKDLQAMDRAHRIGQKKVVNVYRLITRGTLEEKIMGLQQFKLNIANTVVNTENASLKTMDTGGVLDLFSFSATPQEQKKEKKEASGAKLSTKAILEGVEELWDESQYKEEYDLNNFLKNLKQ